MTDCYVGSNTSLIFVCTSLLFQHSPTDIHICSLTNTEYKGMVLVASDLGSLSDMIRNELLMSERG